MTPSLASSIADRLVTASWQGALAIALVWLVCRHVRGIPASVQAALWWLAAARLIAALLPVPAIVLPLLPAPPVPAAVRPAADRPAPALLADTAGGDVIAGAAWDPAWIVALVSAWCVVAFAQVAVLAAACRRHRAIVRRSAAWPHADAVEIARLTKAVGLRRAPQIRVSDDIDVPQVSGFWRPVVLLPAAFEQSLSAAEREMTLGHELMHVKRGDLAWGWVPATAERLFFFHPLARLAAREYLAAREAACDTAIVRALALDPAAYGRTLVRLGVSAPPSPVASAAASSHASLRRRLEMLHDVGSRTPGRARLALAFAFCAFLPLQLGARAPQALQDVVPGGEAVVAPSRSSAAAPGGAIAATIPPAPARSAAEPARFERADGHAIFVMNPDGSSLRQLQAAQAAPAPTPVPQPADARAADDAIDTREAIARLEVLLRQISELSVRRRSPALDDDQFVAQVRAVQEQLRRLAAQDVRTQAEQVRARTDALRFEVQRRALDGQLASVTARLEELKVQLRGIAEQSTQLERQMQQLEEERRRVIEEVERADRERRF